MNDDAQIGAPDGISYEIVLTREETRPTPACGFNDLGAAIGGIFKIETRSYKEYRAGVFVRSWTEDVETFERCVDV